MRAKRTPPRTIRSRDLAAMAAVTVAGAGLIYTALQRGAPPSGNLAIGGFVVATILLIVGFGGGMIIDRIGERYPFLVKARGGALSFLVIVPLLTGILLYAWWERDHLGERLRESGQIILTTVDQTIDQKIAGLRGH